jgi:hypothetical protein
MKKWVLGVIAGFAATTISYAAGAALYAEYYRDNLFLGLAYHRVACLTDWTTIQSNQDYDGFAGNRYCYAGATADSVPNGSWFAYRNATSAAQLDACGAQANNRYGTPDYAGQSNTCSYNVLLDCNSDCWMREFSRCQSGRAVSTLSPCW